MPPKLESASRHCESRRIEKVWVYEADAKQVENRSR